MSKIVSHNMDFTIIIAASLVALICAWLVNFIVGLFCGERPGGTGSLWWDIFSKMGRSPSSYAEPLPDFLKPRKFKIGDRIRVLQVPMEVERSTPVEQRGLLRRCVGKVLRVESIDEFA